MYGGFLDEILIVEDDPLKVLATTIQLPQLLIDGSLIMEHGNDKLLVDIFA